MSDLIKPKSITVTDGEGKTYSLTISKFTAMEGLELQLMFPSSLAVAPLPKIGDGFKIPAELISRIMNYVAVDINGQLIRLSTPQLINNHLGDWEALFKAIWEVMQYNNSFFRNGTIFNFCEDIIQKTLARISEIYTLSSGQSSQPTKPPSTSSEPSIP